MATGDSSDEHRKSPLFRWRPPKDAPGHEGSGQEDRGSIPEQFLSDRPSREHVLMDTARLWAARSTCSRLHVGCVVARESRILTTGYNGAPSGMPHCNHECTCPPGYDHTDRGRGEVHKFGCKVLEPCTISVHAEANAIAFAARYGLGLEGAFLYTTHMPCPNCCMLIVNSGIAAVVWDQDYRDESGLKLLEAGRVGYGKYRLLPLTNDKVDS